MSVFSRKSWVGARLGVKVKGYAAKSLGNVVSSRGDVVLTPMTVKSTFSITLRHDAETPPLGISRCSRPHIGGFHEPE